jgi:hypothetical protein
MHTETLCTSFFDSFSDQQIFSLWTQSKTLLEIAQKLGFQESFLSRADYEAIQRRKTREIWQTFILEKNRKFEWTRVQEIKSVAAPEIESVLESPGIQTLGHLALHFLLSEKHGRSVFRDRIKELQINVKAEVYKGVHGESQTPLHWPTRFYEKKCSKTFNLSILQLSSYSSHSN